MFLREGRGWEVASVPAGPTDELGGMRLTKDSGGFELDPEGAAAPIIRDITLSNMG